MNADEIIAFLELIPHPEGGYFRETFRDEQQQDGRSAGTAIYYLLKAGEVSHWHKVDAAEIWHFYAGSPLLLQTCKEGDLVNSVTLGNDLTAGHSPQSVVPAGIWQSAQSLGEWTLVGCTVAPGFEFSGFTMAPDGWHPEKM